MYGVGDVSSFVRWWMDGCIGNVFILLLIVSAAARKLVGKCVSE